MSGDINDALLEIKRGTSEIIGFEYIEKLVSNYFTNGTRFSVKVGFDPTAPDLHLGHSVLLQKMAILQRYGGNIKFLIGDFTATIGDPTGKSETRKVLSFKEVEDNAKTYQDQVFKILSPEHTEICFNSKWLHALGSSGMLELTSKFSVARMLERDDFSKRHKDNLPISIVEFIYPLLQGYDSVFLNCDIECGGNDQKFNLIVGRHMQRSYGLNKEQSVLMMPLLEGLDGVNKMSKSLGNYIAINDAPNDMYAKIMSISDSMMWRYYELLSSISLHDLNKLKLDVDSGILHPKTAKENLALEIVTRYYDIDKANNARENFNLVFSKNSIPENIDECIFESDIWICKLLVMSNMSSSTSQARRDIRSGALRINGEKNTDENLKLKSGIHIIQIGKRKFLRAIIK